MIFCQRIEDLSDALHADFQFVFHILCDERFDAVMVERTENRKEVLQIVILASQTDDENTTGIRMQDDTFQNVLCDLEILAHL